MGDSGTKRIFDARLTVGLVLLSRPGRKESGDDGLAAADLDREWNVRIVGFDARIAKVPCIVCGRTFRYDVRTLEVMSNVDKRRV